MTFWITVAVLAGLVMFGCVVHLAVRWRRLERLVVRKIRHHERVAQHAADHYVRQWHKAQVQALDEMLIAMADFGRGSWADAYTLQPPKAAVR